MADAGAAAGNAAQKRRFATLSDNEYAVLLKERESNNTRKATELAVRTFRAYLTEKGLDPEFENISCEDLDNCLSKFYVEARSSNGEIYKKTTLVSIRHGINRHLTNCDSKFDIINGADFKKSQTAFKAMVVQMKKDGKGGIEHHPPIDSGDLLKLYDYFYANRDNHEILQFKVLVDVMLHLARRGRENLRELKITDFWLTTDGDQMRYIYVKADEQTKNHQTDNNTAAGRMYEIKDSDRCPLQSFIKYKKLLNPGCPFLFQRARATPNKSGYLFDNAPIGHNKLGTMMSVLSQKAELSRKYTNHSLRATSVHLLDAANIPTRHIMTVTGHKAETSLKTYTGHTDNKTKKIMSNIITNSTGAVADMEKSSKQDECAQNLNSPDINMLDSILEPVTNSQYDDLMDQLNADPEFDQILADLPSNSSNGSVISAGVSNVFSCNYQWNTGFQPYPQPMITGQNAQITINYNIFNH